MLHFPNQFDQCVPVCGARLGWVMTDAALDMRCDIAASDLLRKDLLLPSLNRGTSPFPFELFGIKDPREIWIHAAWADWRDLARCIKSNSFNDDVDKAIDAVHSHREDMIITLDDVSSEGEGVSYIHREAFQDHMTSEHGLADAYAEQDSGQDSEAVEVEAESDSEAEHDADVVEVEAEQDTDVAEAEQDEEWSRLLSSLAEATGSSAMDVCMVPTAPMIDAQRETFERILWGMFEFCVEKLHLGKLPGIRLDGHPLAILSGDALRLQKQASVRYIRGVNVNNGPSTYQARVRTSDGVERSCKYFKTQNDALLAAGIAFFQLFAGSDFRMASEVYTFSPYALETSEQPVQRIDEARVSAPNAAAEEAARVAVEQAAELTPAQKAAVTRKKRKAAEMEVDSQVR